MTFSNTCQDSTSELLHESSDFILQRLRPPVCKTPRSALPPCLPAGELAESWAQHVLLRPQLFLQRPRWSFSRCWASVAAERPRCGLPPAAGRPSSTHAPRAAPHRSRRPAQPLPPAAIHTHLTYGLPSALPTEAMPHSGFPTPMPRSQGPLLPRPGCLTNLNLRASWVIFGLLLRDQDKGP